MLPRGMDFKKSIENLQPSPRVWIFILCDFHLYLGPLRMMWGISSASALPIMVSPSRSWYRVIPVDKMSSSKPEW